MIGVKSVVTYVPSHLRQIRKGRELGIVKRIDGETAFVDYNGSVKATRMCDLMEGDETFYCEDEHKSVMHRSFGRCESECFNCSNLRKFMENISV